LTQHPHESRAEIYLATIVRIKVGDEWLSAQQAAATLGAIHILTAWNPGDERPTPEENDAANEALLRRLEAEGCNPVPARGSDPNFTYAEESWCVVGLSDERAREIGAQFRQWAVFRITATEQTVLGCFGDWERSRSI
jgi:hypothetical protein